MIKLPSAAQFAKLSELTAEVKGLTITDLNHELIGKALMAFDVEPTPERVAALMEHAAIAGGKQPIMAWATKMYQDGTLTEMLNLTPTEQTIMHRCVFCAQPNTVPKPASGQTIMHRCVFCEQPNTVSA